MKVFRWISRQFDRLAFGEMFPRKPDQDRQRIEERRIELETFKMELDLWRDLKLMCEKIHVPIDEVKLFAKLLDLEKRIHESTLRDLEKRRVVVKEGTRLI